MVDPEKYKNIVLYFISCLLLSRIDHHFVNLITNQLDIRKMAIQTELETNPRYTDGLSNPHPLVMTSLIDWVAAVQGK